MIKKLGSYSINYTIAFQMMAIGRQTLWIILSIVFIGSILVIKGKNYDILSEASDQVNTLAKLKLHVFRCPQTAQYVTLSLRH